MLKKFKDTFGKASHIFREYPMVLLLAFFGALSFILTSDRHPQSNDFIFLKLGLVSCLGISLLYSLKMLSQRIGKSILLETSGIAFLVLFYFLLPAQEKDFTEQYAFLLIPTFILSHLLVSFIAFLGVKREMYFWQFNKNLFINIFLTAIFTGVLVGGVELAILAIDQLFDFNFDGEYYRKTFILLAIFGSCFIFLLFNEKGLQDLEKDGSYPLILKFFTQYILIPLLFIYVVILYFYAGKILINWELPRGWVSYLVLAYSVVGILGLLLVHPLKDASTKSWVQMFSKIFYYTLIPLIALLFTAIFTRILAYGYTEPRYFVLLLAAWLSSVVLYFAFSRKTTIKFVPVSLFVFGLFSLIFPYLNTFSVAIRSQKKELKEVLVQNNLLENGNINFDKKVSDTVVDELSDKFKYLAERKQGDFLKHFLKKEDEKIVVKNLEKADFWKISNEIRSRFTKIENTKSSFGKRLELISKAKFQNIENYDYYISVDLLRQEELVFNNDKFEIIAPNTNKNLLVFAINKEQWNITPFLEKTIAAHKEESGIIPVSEITAEKDLGAYHVKIVFNNLIRENVQDSVFYYNTPILLIKKK